MILFFQNAILVFTSRMKTWRLQEIITLTPNHGIVYFFIIIVLLLLLLLWIFTPDFSVLRASLPFSCFLPYSDLPFHPRHNDSCSVFPTPTLTVLCPDPTTACFLPDLHISSGIPVLPQSSTWYLSICLTQPIITITPYI